LALIPESQVDITRGWFASVLSGRREKARADTPMELISKNLRRFIYQYLTIIHFFRQKFSLQVISRIIVQYRTLIKIFKDNRILILKGTGSIIYPI
jgi:hypothetical protein